jgi:hypothetical protein
MRQAPFAFALTLIAAASAHAAAFKLGSSVEGKLDATTTLGTMVRTGSPDPSDYALIPSTLVPGVAPGQLAGQTGGSDLNFEKGHPVSTVLKGLFDLDLHSANLGLFVRASVWHDFTLGHADARYGNYPNAYLPDMALSDRGFAPGARFSGALVREAYVQGQFEAGAAGKLQARVGRQVLKWGVSQFVTGGIDAAINPVDYAGQLRPGALPEEGKLGVGMLSLNLAEKGPWGLDAFVPYESRASVLPGCGTFFDTASIIPQGCNLAAAIGNPIPGTPLSTIGSLTEPSLLASGYYVHRNPDQPAPRGGHFGLSARWRWEAAHTDLRAVYLTTPSTMPYLQLKVEDVGGATLPPGLAGGLARLTNANGLQYRIVYPDDVHLLGLSFNTQFSPLRRVFGELTYRSNQPLGMNGNDLLTGSLLRTPTSLLALNTPYLSVPAGGSFDAFERFKVSTASLGINQVLPKVLGAAHAVLAAELGLSHVSGLPDASVMRYGRAFAYGTAPYLFNGSLTPCSEAVPGLSGVAGKTCTTDGFITRTASGLRLYAAAAYPNALFGATLTPSLLVAHDLGGYAYDGSFSAGRTLLRPELRLDWGKRYFAQLQYAHFSGGKYNLLADRSNLVLAAGARF